MRDLIADAVRRALEAAGADGDPYDFQIQVRPGSSEETEEDAIVRAVLEEPSDTFTVTFRIPAHLDYVHLQMSIDGPDEAER